MAYRHIMRDQKLTEDGQRAVQQLWPSCLPNASSNLSYCEVDGGISCYHRQREWMDPQACSDWMLSQCLPCRSGDSQVKARVSF